VRRQPDRKQRRPGHHLPAPFQQNAYRHHQHERGQPQQRPRIEHRKKSARQQNRHQDDRRELQRAQQPTAAQVLALGQQPAVRAWRRQA
jgi:hypothetical protein